LDYASFYVQYHWFMGILHDEFGRWEKEEAAGKTYGFAINAKKIFLQLALTEQDCQYCDGCNINLNPGYQWTGGP
jgi:hypothetical protein